MGAHLTFLVRIIRKAKKFWQHPITTRVLEHCGTKPQNVPFWRHFHV